jgi:hypothetical protein
MPPVALAPAPTARSTRGRGAKVSSQVLVHRQPDPADLKLIQGLALVPVKAEDVAVYTARVASTQIDRDRERFSVELLQDYAETFPGKALLVGHPWMFGDMAQVPTGRVFKAWTQQEGDDTWLFASFYFDASAKTQELIGKINLGIVSYVSIGYFAPQYVEHYDSKTGNFDYVDLMRGPNGEKGEALELSLVFLGSQKDAYLVKSAVKALPVTVPQSRERLLAAIEEGRMDRKGFVAAMGKLVDQFFGGKAADEPNKPPDAKPPGEEEKPPEDTGAKAMSKTDLMTKCQELMDGIASLPDDEEETDEMKAAKAAKAEADAKAAKEQADAEAAAKAAKDEEAKKDQTQPEGKQVTPPAPKAERPRGAKEGTVEDKEFQAAISAIGAKVDGGLTKILSKLGDIEKRLEKVEGVADEMEQAGAKMLDRIEGIEGAMSGARGGPDEEEPPPTAAGAAGGTGKKQVSMFNQFVPREYARRAGIR